MNKFLLLVLIFVSLSMDAQNGKYNRVVLNFYPSFEQSSTLVIKFNKMIGKFKIEGAKQNHKFEISVVDKEKLVSAMNKLYKDLEAPIDTIMIDGQQVLIDTNLSEDGMTTYISFNRKEHSKIQLGNSYSRIQKEVLTAFINLMKTRNIESDYADKIEKYL
jgi:hypothetical protein